MNNPEIKNVALIVVADATIPHTKLPIASPPTMQEWNNESARPANQLGDVVWIAKL